MSTLAFNDVYLEQSLIARPPHPLCRAVVVIPARNEEDVLAVALEAMYRQEDLQGKPLDPRSYEVLLLLNNCTDGSASIALRFQQEHPELELHILECTLEAAQAHVGTARRMLMDTACARLEYNLASVEAICCAILSTDADTAVAPDWIAQNLAAIEAGADAVGGVIDLFPGSLDSLDDGTRSAYLLDRTLQHLVAQFESRLDPDPADPWPRHQQHFGASIACTAAIYRTCGGLPPVKPLEDVAFVDALRKVGARIRHSPEVHTYTSARFTGRSEVGLSGQLRDWHAETEQAIPQIVDSAEWLEHRFRSLAYLRRVNEGAATLQINRIPRRWRASLIQLRAERLPTARFLELLDCNGLIEAAFASDGRFARWGQIAVVIERLEEKIAMLEAAQEHPDESVCVSGDRSRSTQGARSSSRALDLRSEDSLAPTP